LEKMLSFAEVLAKAEPKQHKVFVEELDAYIPYGDLTLEDFAEIYDKKSNPVELSTQVVFKAWRKADSTVTLEGIRKKIAVKIVIKIMNEIVGKVLLAGPLGKALGVPSAEPSTN